MRLFLLMLYFLFLESCTTMEATKEIIKAGSSAKTTVSEIISNKEDDSKMDVGENIETKIEAEIEEKIDSEKEIITTEQKEQKNIIEIQQKISQINFLGNSLNEIKKILDMEDISYRN